MNFFEKPNLFRILFGLWATVLLAVFVISFYRTGTSPTDENLFRDPPSSLYVKTSPQIPPDQTIKMGDLVLKIGSTSVKGMSDLEGALRKVSTKDVQVSILRLTENKDYTFTIPRDFLSDKNIRQLDQTAYVIEVSEGGASDRAGMKVGDLITKINGQTFNNANDADRLLREGEAGKSSDYDVLRNNVVLRLHVTLAPFGIPMYLLLLGTACIIFVSAGIFLAFTRPQYAAARLLGFSFLSLGFSLGMILIRRSPYLPVDALLVCNLTFAIPFWFHSTLYFPKERPGLLSRRWLRIIPYLVAPVVVVSTLVWGNVGLFLGLFVLTAYSITVRVVFRKSVESEYKKLIRPVAWAGRLVGLLCGGLALAIIFVFGQTGAAQAAVGMMGIVLVLLPLSYFYTIGRYHLLDLDLRIRRSSRYNILATGLRIGFLLLAGFVLYLLAMWEPLLPNINISSSYVELLNTQISPERLDFLQNILITAIAIATGLIFLWLGRIGLSWLAVRFHREQYDYRRAANELANTMATRLTMTSLGQGIVEKLAELMHIKHVGVLFFRNESICCCQEAYGFDGREWKEFCINSEVSLVDAIKEARSETRVDYLSPALKKAFQQHNFQLVIPIWSKEKLIGAIVVGEKMSEALFDREDMEFLGSIAKQASVAIENAFLYEELTEQERMKHELAIARRIQLESLPQQTPSMQGLDIAGTSLPALEVGGDYYDYLNGAVGKLTVVVGDVSGKGTSAALYMSKVQGILRSLHGFVQSPRDLFVRTNQLLCGDLEKKSFVTAIAGAFDLHTKNVTIARAGHLPLFQYKADTHRVEQIVPAGIGLALSADTVFSLNMEECVLGFSTGDIFLFISDGITEAKTEEGIEFGEERVRGILAQYAHEPAAVIRDRVLQELKDFAGSAPQHDDQTVVVVRIVE